MRNIFEELGDDKFYSIQETIRQYFKRKVKNPYDVEDMTQEVLKRICQKGEDLKADTWQNWVSKVAHNLWNDELKKRKKQNEAFISVGLLEIERTEHRNLSDLDAEVVNKESREELYKYLRQLPDAYKAAIVLHYLLGHSYAEISIKLEIPLNTVKSHSLRGIKKLRERMRGEKRY